MRHNLKCQLGKMKGIAVPVIFLLLIFVVGLSFPASSDCADCAKGGSVDQSCQNEKDNAYTECCGVFGCGIGQPGYDYCQNRGEETYNGCVTLNGCPNLAD